MQTRKFQLWRAALGDVAGLLMGCGVPAGHRLNITAENDCRRLHCSLRDLSSLLQAVGRLAEYFTGDVFAARFNDALTVVERWVQPLAALQAQ